MSEHWKTKSDRAHAHQLLEKAWLAEFDAEKTRTRLLHLKHTEDNEDLRLKKQA